MTEPETTAKWIVIKQQIIGNPETWATDYEWIGDSYPSAAEAFEAGCRILDHDDFNVGRIEKGRLVAFGYYDYADEFRNFPNDVVAVATYLEKSGYEVRP